MSDSTDSEKGSIPALDPTGQEAEFPWMLALNRFLERVYLQADVSTGC